MTHVPRCAGQCYHDFFWSQKIRFRGETMNALQETAEAFMVGNFEMINLLATWHTRKSRGRFLIWVGHSLSRSDLIGSNLIWLRTSLRCYVVSFLRRCGIRWFRIIVECVNVFVLKKIKFFCRACGSRYLSKTKNGRYENDNQMASSYHGTPRTNRHSAIMTDAGHLPSGGDFSPTMQIVDEFIDWLGAGRVVLTAWEVGDTDAAENKENWGSSRRVKQINSGTEGFQIAKKAEMQAFDEKSYFLLQLQHHPIGQVPVLPSDVVIRTQFYHL